MRLNTDLQIPEIWGDASFERSEWGDLNFLIGPNGTGKSLFAESLNEYLNTSSYSTRYLSADRLSGMVSFGSFVYRIDDFDDGIDLSDENRLRKGARREGYSYDAYLLLRDKPDLKIRVQATLSEYFDREIELSEKGGYLVPTILDQDSSEQYDLRQNESHGLKELIALLTIIYDDDSDVVIIDEPELHLHPQYQKFLLQEMRSLANSQQNSLSKTFFVVTHSPVMIEFRTLEDVYNTLSFRDKSVPPYTVDRLSDEIERDISGLLPRLTTNHKEALFSKRPILVEGYRDKQIFSIAISKHEQLRNDPSSTIVSLDGKDEINAFFIFCSELGIEPRIIGDLDVLFRGSLKQTLSEHDAIKSGLIDAGLGRDLMGTTGSILSDLSTMVDQLEKEDYNCLNGVLADAHKHLNQTSDSNNQQYIMYRALILDKESASAVLDPDDVELTLSQMSKTQSVLSDNGYHILEQGELENYLRSEDSISRVSTKAKGRIFDRVRRELLDSDNSSEVSDIVGDLVEILSEVLRTKEVDILEYAQTLISDWIHHAQAAIDSGEVHSKEELRTHPRLSQENYDRLFTIEQLEIDDDGRFRCVLRLKSSIDSNKNTVSFDETTLPYRVSIGGQPHD